MKDGRNLTHCVLLQINVLIDGTESVTSKIQFVVPEKLNLNPTLCDIEIISLKKRKFVKIGTTRVLARDKPKPIRKAPPVSNALVT